MCWPHLSIDQKNCSSNHLLTPPEPAARSAVESARFVHLTMMMLVSPQFLGLFFPPSKWTKKWRIHEGDSKYLPSGMILQAVVELQKIRVFDCHMWFVKPLKLVPLASIQQLFLPVYHWQARKHGRIPPGFVLVSTKYLQIKSSLNNKNIVKKKTSFFALLDISNKKPDGVRFGGSVSRLENGMFWRKVYQSA